MPSPSGSSTLSKPAPRFASIGSPPYFGIMLAIMAVVLILSNIGASKGVVIGPIITDGGFFLFPIAYILGDVMSEVYGFKVARKASSLRSRSRCLHRSATGSSSCFPASATSTAPQSKQPSKVLWARFR